MNHKRFYQSSGTRRKEQCRSRKKTAELDSCWDNNNSDDDDSNPFTSTHLHSSSEERQTFVNNNEIELTPDMDIDEVSESNSPLFNYSDDDRTNDDDLQDLNSDMEDGSAIDFDNYPEFIEANKERKLYPNSALSVHDACSMLIRISHRLNLNKLQLNCLMKSVKQLLPNDNKLPRTVNGLAKVIRESCLVSIRL